MSHVFINVSVAQTLVDSYGDETVLVGIQNGRRRKEC